MVAYDGYRLVYEELLQAGHEHNTTLNSGSETQGAPFRAQRPHPANRPAPPQAKQAGRDSACLFLLGKEGTRSHF